MASDSRVECPVCLEVYSGDLPQRVPRILPCGHTLCTGCADGVTERGRVLCPSRCVESARVGSDGASSLPKNFALLQGDALVGGGQEPVAAVGGSRPRVVERAQLVEAKSKAIADEDYDLAKQLKAEIEALDAAIEVEAHSEEQRIAQIAALEEQKATAVADENFDRAKQLKEEIESLRRAAPSQTREVCCYDLGAGLGALLCITPKMPAAPTVPERPLPIVLLDRSPSMGGTAKWAVNVAVPAALRSLGYTNTDRCILVTFDSEVERVRHRSCDYTLQGLTTADISCRGRTTLLAPAVRVLDDILRENTSKARIVFVISDGHVFDLPLVRSRADAAVKQGGGVVGRVAFALFRFFNGEPPDTVALAAVASLGSAGSAPCVDCYPPAQWSCPACTVLNPYMLRRCELCDTQRPGGAGEGDAEDDALRNFVETASTAFAPTLAPCARVTAAAPFRRLPCRSWMREETADVMYGQQSCFMLDQPIPEISLDGRRLPVELVRRDGSFGEQERNSIEIFCTSSIAQLRLWLVGGTRQDEFSEAGEWFRRLAQCQQPHGSATMNGSGDVLARARAMRQRVAEGESALGRLCALADARSFVGDLNSKQQGDFLRGSSVARADRLLARRALGPDIVYHEACRSVVSNASPLHEAEEQDFAGKEQRFVSYFSGSSYADSLQAACLLSGSAEDLSAVDILEVIGGLGVPFSANTPSRPDDIWSLTINFIKTGVFLSEADIWAAAACGEALQLDHATNVTGVVPLALSGGVAHARYEDTFSAVSLLHIGSQLRGAPPRHGWGWEPQQPPYAIDVARGVREAAALRCVALQCIAGSLKPSRSEAEVAAALHAQLARRRTHMLADPLVAAASEILRGSQDASPARMAFLPFLVAAVTLSVEERSANLRSGLSPCIARLLYWQEVLEAAERNGVRQISTPAQSALRREALISLVAASPEQQKMAVTEEQVLDRLNSRIGSTQEIANNTGATIMDPVDTVAVATDIAERLQGITWVPPAHTVMGLCRVTATDVSGSVADATERLQCCHCLSSSEAWYGKEERDGGVDVGALFVAVTVAAALADTSVAPVFAALLENPVAVCAELQRLLREALREDHAQRLNKEVTERLLQLRTAARQQQSLAVLENSAPQIDSGLSDLLNARDPTSEDVIDFGEGRKEHLSFVFCGPSGCGKSTLAARLLVEMGRISPQQMKKNKDEAERLGAPSRMLAFAMDRCKQERERGASMYVTKDYFQTEKRFCSLVDTPGHRNFQKHTLKGISQADVGVLLVPADGQFASAVATGNHTTGELEGQVRMHARILCISGVKQLIVLVCKMDSDAVRFEQARFQEVCDEVRSCLVKVGWKKDFVENRVPMLPVCGWLGDNLVQRSSAMAWWHGHEVLKSEGRVNVSTFVEAVDNAMETPERKVDSPLRIPISGVFRIRGVGHVVTGRVECGMLKAGDKVSFPASGGTATAASLEMHHQRIQPVALAGDIIGVSLRGIDRNCCPQVGDVLVGGQTEDHLPPAQSFTAQLQVLNHPGELKVGYTPLCVVRTSRMHVRLERLVWKIGRSTGGKKMEDPSVLRSNELAEAVFRPLGPFIVDSFNSCDGLSRLLFFDAARGDGAACVMVGKVVSVVRQEHR